MPRKLRPFPTEPNYAPKTPRCQAQVQVLGERDADWRAKRYGDEPPFTCTRPSVVELGGKFYCRLHAGHVALDMLLRGDLVEKPK